MLAVVLLGLFHPVVCMGAYTVRPAIFAVTPALACQILSQKSILTAAQRASRAWPLPGSGARARASGSGGRAQSDAPHHVAWPLEQFLQPAKQAARHACMAACMEFPYGCMDTMLNSGLLAAC